MMVTSSVSSPVASGRKPPEVSIELVTAGSTNGIALAAAGAADMGLASRPLRNAEELFGLTYRPCARTAVALGSDPGGPDIALTAADLLSIYRGDRHRWDSGREMALLSREDGDNSSRSRSMESHRRPPISPKADTHSPSLWILPLR